MLGACRCLRAAAGWQAAADGLRSEYLKPADDASGRVVVNGSVTGLACVAVVGTSARAHVRGAALGLTGRSRAVRGAAAQEGSSSCALTRRRLSNDQRCELEAQRGSLPLFSSTR